MKGGGWLVVAFVVLAWFGIYQESNVVASTMDAIAHRLFGLFRDEHFPLLLAAAVLVAGGVIWAGYLFFVVMPHALHLARLTKAVRQPETREDFAESFDQVDAELKKSPLVGHAWDEFSETLVMPEDGVRVIQNTTRPHTFINYNCITDHSKALRIMPHLPNYFIGVGLLLTFAGLVAALFFANTAVGGNVNQAVAGLKNLLAAATFKFWTSIAGLLASIALSFSFRLFSISLEGRLTTLCRAIEQQMSFATPQRIFVHIRNTIEEQLAETKKINTDIAMSIAEGVSEQFQKHVPPMLADALQPLVKAVDESSSKVGQSAIEGVQEMVNRFKEQLEGSAGTYMEQMASTLQQLNQSLAAMDGSMNSSSDEFARRMAEGSERLDATMQEVARALRELIEGLKEEVGQAGRAFGSTLEESLDRLSRQSEALATQIADQSREASSAFAAEIGKAAELFSKTADDSARSSAEFAEQIRASLGEGINGVRGGLERLSATLIELGAQLSRQGEEMSAVAGRSREAAQAMSEAAQGVRSGLAPFQEVGRNLMEAGKNIERSTIEVAQRIEAASTAMQGTAEQLDNVSKALQDAWKNYQKRFESVDKDLERAFQHLHEGIKQQQRHVQDFVRKLDASFSNALSGLSGGIVEMNSNIEELTEALKEMRQAASPA